MYKDLYAFLNIDHLFTAWECAIGRMASAGIYSNGYGISNWLYGRLQTLKYEPTNRYVLDEFRLETIRQKDFQHQVSRLKGLYFFENKEDAFRAHASWGSDFSLQYICKIRFLCNNFCKVDSSWITNCLGAEDGSWMKHYWNGESYDDNPLYEIIAEGIGYILEPLEVRKEAYKLFFEYQNTSTPLRSISCCAFSRGFNNISRIVPYLYIKDNKLNGSYIIDMETLDNYESEIGKVVDDCIKKNELPSACLPKDENIVFTLPDLSEYNFTLELTDTEFRDIQPHFTPR